jgi:hypothetical protein
LLGLLAVSLETVETEKTHTNIHAYVGFEPTIAVLERAKTVRALDPAATAIGFTGVSGTGNIRVIRTLQMFK